VETPPSRSESDASSDSDETPPPTKVSPVTPTTVPAIRLAEIQRDPSVKSVTGKIENGRSKSPPPTPKQTKPKPPLAGSPPKVTAPMASPKGTGFVGKKETVTDPVPAIPPISVAPPSPNVVQFPKDTIPKAAKQDESTSGSVTADILRLSVAETDITSTHTSMVVEPQSRVNSTIEESPSRQASSIFEMEYTPPLVISKVEDATETNEKNSKDVKVSGVKAEKKSEGAETLEFSLPPTLPALERGSLFTFGDLT
jgi:hypothetical protein